MSPKELLYIEDALAHQEHLLTKCKDYAPRFQDSELSTMMNQLATKHQEIYKQLYGLLKS